MEQFQTPKKMTAGAKVGLGFGVALIMIVMGLAFTFGQTSMEYKLAGGVSIAERKLRTLRDRVDLCNQMTLRDQNEKEDNLGISDTEVQQIQERRAELQVEKTVADEQLKDLQYKVDRFKEIYGDDENDYDIFGGMDILGLDNSNQDDYGGGDFGDLMGIGDPFVGSETKKELEDLRTQHDSLLEDKEQLAKKNVQLRLGLTSTQFKRDSNLLACRKELTKREAPVKKGKGDSVGTSQGEHEIAELKAKNEELERALRSPEALAKDEEIVRMKADMQSELTILQRTKEIEKQIATLRDEGANFQDIERKIKEGNDLLEKRNKEMNKQRDETLKALREELKKKKEAKGK